MTGEMVTSGVTWPASMGFNAATLKDTDRMDRTEQFVIVGDVGSSIFPVWIARHAARLGVKSRVLSQAVDRLEMVVTGPADLLDAMALGCSLDPQEVLVDDVHRLQK